MKPSLSFVLVMVFLILGFVLRVIWLDQYPVGFTSDEAQQGLDAYSLLHTGKDFWGQSFPLFPRGFGDFKPPLYTYLTIPSVAVFGLTEFAIRFPAVVMGTMSILLIYLISKTLFDQKVALVTALLFAINPWAIQLSRTAFEGGSGVVFFLAGLYFYLQKNRKWFLILSALCFGITLYSYHSFRVVTAGMIGMIVLKELFKTKKLSQPYFISGLILGVFLLPLFLNFPLILKRSSDVGIISSKYVAQFFENKTTSDLPQLVDKLIDNKYSAIGGQFFSNYLSYFSPSFLFTGNRSDSSYLNFPQTPLLYGIELITVGFGIYFLFKRKYPFGFVLIGWALIGPIPAALTDSFNANRAVALVGLPTLLSGLGINELIELGQKRYPSYLKTLKVFLWGSLLYGFILFLYTYFYTLPLHPAYNLRYGYKESFTRLVSIQDQFNEIHISKNFSMPFVLIALYNIQQNTGYITLADLQAQSPDWLRYEKADKMYIDQLESYNLKKYKFHDLDWIRDSQIENALLIGSPDNFPEKVKSVFDIHDPKGKILYRFVSTKEVVKAS